MGQIPITRQRLHTDLLQEPSLKPRRGRPRNHPGREDFVLEQVDRCYAWLSKRFQNSKLAPRTYRRPPSEWAYRYLVERAPRVLGNIDWTTLRNKHTEWKRGRYHGIEHCTHSEEYEAEIDRQFPVS